MADRTFLGVEIYRHTEDLSSRDRAWCAANATLRYEGTGQSFSDTGLTAGTQYYYKVFAKYDVDGSTYYSSGAVSNATTLVAPPTVVSAATNTAGTVITITFSKAMANPAGKHAQFSATVAGSARGVTAASLNADTTKLDLTLASAVTSGQVVTISYTVGDVTSSDTSPLGSFSGQSVTNNVASAYQQWETYPQTPALTSTYPYQCILRTPYPDVYLLYSSAKIYKASSINWNSPGNVGYYRHLNNSLNQWESQLATYNTTFPSTCVPIQANNDVYTDSTLTTVLLAKTTP